ncbi:helix-turn-helix domain-containing protein [Mucilaginibacter sp. AW1-3]
MISLGNLVILGSIFFSLLACIILFIRKSKKIYANRLLSVTFLGFIWYAATIQFAMTGWIKHLTAIYGLGIPLYYATPVFGYLHTRALIKQQIGFSKFDWLLFLPAILCFLALSPFYFADMQTKQKLVDWVSQSYYNVFYCKIGLVSNSWHFILRPIEGIIYVILQWRLILPAIKSNNQTVMPVMLKRWLVVFAAFLTLAYINLAVATVLGISHMTRDMDLFAVIRIPFMGCALSFLGVSLLLFFFPEILYNINSVPLAQLTVAGDVKDRVTEDPIKTLNNYRDTTLAYTTGEKESALNTELVSSYAEIIEHYIQTHSFFRRQGITVNDLAVGVGISPRHVSYVLNHHFDQRFTDFINTYRVNYLLTRFLNNNWRELSLEGLAKEAGFASRTTFFMAFKKQTGHNPTEYIQKISAKSTSNASADMAV